MSQMRGLAPHYITGMYGATSFKEKMNHIARYDDLKNIIDEYREYLNGHHSS